jgi:hypothetical protein
MRTSKAKDLGKLREFSAAAVLTSHRNRTLEVHRKNEEYPEH